MRRNITDKNNRSKISYRSEISLDTGAGAGSGDNVKVCAGANQKC